MSILNQLNQRQPRARRKPIISIFQEEPLLAPKVNRSVSPFNRRKRPMNPKKFTNLQNKSELRKFISPSPVAPMRHDRFKSQSQIMIQDLKDAGKISKNYTQNYHASKTMDYGGRNRNISQSNIYSRKVNRISPSLENYSKYYVPKRAGFNAYQDQTSLLSRRVPQFDSKSGSEIGSVALSQISQKISRNSSMTNGAVSRRSIKQISNRNLPNKNNYCGRVNLTQTNPEQWRSVSNTPAGKQKINHHQFKTRRGSKFISDANMSLIKSKSFVNDRVEDRYRPNLSRNQSYIDHRKIHSKTFHGYQSNQVGFSGYPLANQYRSRDVSRIENNFGANQKNQNLLHIKNNYRTEPSQKFHQTFKGFNTLENYRNPNIGNQKSISQFETQNFENMRRNYSRNQSVISGYSNISGTSQISRDPSLGFKIKRRMKTEDKIQLKRDMKGWQKRIPNSPFGHLKNQENNLGQSQYISPLQNFSGVLSQNISQISRKNDFAKNNLGYNKYLQNQGLPK